MSIAIVIFLIVIGFILLLVEIFITPGIILGVVGLAFMSAGIFKVYTDYGNQTGNLTLLGLTVLTVGLIFYAMRAGVWDKIAQKQVITGKANLIDQDLFNIGDKGKSLSALRPSGNALINGKKIEVTTEGEAVPNGQEIEIIKIKNNKIFVKHA